MRYLTGSAYIGAAKQAGMKAQNMTWHVTIQCDKVEFAAIQSGKQKAVLRKHGDNGNTAELARMLQKCKEHDAITFIS